MRWGIWLVLAGCNQIFGVEQTAFETADARVDAPGCSGAPFSNPQPLTGSVFTSEFDPSVSGNPLEIWFTRDDGSDYNLHFATRASLQAGFDMQGTYSYNSTDNDSDAALSADGLSLLFISNRLGSFFVFEARRTTTNDAFGPPMTIAPSIDQNDVSDGIDLSFDGLRLYYCDGTGDLRMVERSARGQPFGPPGEVLATAVHFPSLSPDELELFYERKDPVGGGTLGLFHMTRTTTTMPFATPFEPVIAGVYDAEIAPDSMHLYYSVYGALGVMTRTCN